MYNINSNNFGEQLRKARKSKGISIAEIAKKLNKMETTVYKYERNVLMPDLQTVLEICNILDVGFDDLATRVKIEETKENSNNPFNVNTLYLYYLGFNNRIVTFKLEIISEGGFQRVYFKDITTNNIFFVGTLESSHDIAYITMKNYYATNKKFEKVEIILNLKYSSDEKYMGLINGTDDTTNEPLTKKCLVSKIKKESITEEDVKELKSRLKVTEKEIKDIEEKNCWNMDINNKTDYNVI